MAAEENPPTEKTGNRWVATATASGYHHNEDHVTQMKTLRLDEWQQMLELVQSPACLMTTMRRLLDDSYALEDEKCGKCDVCCSRNPAVTSDYCGL